MGLRPKSKDRQAAQTCRRSTPPRSPPVLSPPRAHGHGHGTHYPLARLSGTSLLIPGRGGPWGAGVAGRTTAYVRRTRHYLPCRGHCPPSLGNGIPGHAVDEANRGQAGQPRSLLEGAKKAARTFGHAAEIALAGEARAPAPCSVGLILGNLSRKLVFAA